MVLGAVVVALMMMFSEIKLQHVGYKNLLSICVHKIQTHPNKDMTKET
jgi:hypothetical protein